MCDSPVRIDEAVPLTTRPSQPSSKQKQLRRYLLVRIHDGDRYFKCKFIASDIDLSANEVGALLMQLRESASDLRIEKWSYSSATTWRIEPV